MEKIKIHCERHHSKASERYLDVTFNYDRENTWEGAIPIEYRRTGTDLSDRSEIDEYLLQAYDHCNPQSWRGWIAEQEKFWSGKPNASVTKDFFNALTTFTWSCIECKLPKNPNWARRIQDLKEFGYTISTNTNKQCVVCQSRKTHLILVPLPRGGLSGYEVWSPIVRNRIISVLNSYDVYEAKSGKKDGLLPDHKFPEIRWSLETRRSSLNDLTDEQIKKDFQLMSNQRNQQKREVCRNCYQTDIRGYPFGIKFYYMGNEIWSQDVPKIGKDAEIGCIGCGWYDMKQWRIAINQKLAESITED